MGKAVQKQLLEIKVRWDNIIRTMTCNKKIIAHAIRNRNLKFLKLNNFNEL